MPFLAVIETHPIQYHVPVYRTLRRGFRIAVTAIDGSDFSVEGHRDQKFGATFACREKMSGYAAPQAVGIIRAFSELARRGPSIVYCT